MAEMKSKRIRKAEPIKVEGKALEPDWGTPCETCGERPTVPLTGMCGPCTWGEADTAGGNW